MAMSETGNPIEIAERIIKEIKLTPENIDAYENCEIITDMMDEDVLNEINDQDFRKLLQDTRRLHSEVRRMNYPVYINMARELFEKIPDENYILRYHEVEQLSKRIKEQEIMQIKDVKLRETLERLKHIHDDIAIKKANIIRKMKLY